jgi:hypothetical protein
MSLPSALSLSALAADDDDEESYVGTSGRGVVNPSVPTLWMSRRCLPMLKLLTGIKHKGHGLVHRCCCFLACIVFVWRCLSVLLCSPSQTRFFFGIEKTRQIKRTTPMTFKNGDFLHPTHAVHNRNDML